MHKRRRKEDDEEETRSRQQNQITLFRPTDLDFQDHFLWLRTLRPSETRGSFESTPLNSEKTDQYKNLKGTKHKVKYLRRCLPHYGYRNFAPALSPSRKLPSSTALFSLSRQLPSRAQRRHKALTDRRSQGVNGGKYR